MKINSISQMSFIYFSFLLLCFLGCHHVEIKEVKSTENVIPVKEVQSLSSFIRPKETLRFSVRWLGMEVGTAEAVVKGIEKVRGRDAYHIAAYARSNSLIDLIYPVRDEHHTYIDVEHLH